MAIIQVCGKSLANPGHGLDRDHLGKHAGKVGVQRAAGVGRVPTVVAARTAAVMMSRAVGVALGAMVAPVIGMRKRNIRAGSRIGAWRRYDAGELRHQEYCDQQSDKATYRAEPIHRRVDISAVVSSLLWPDDVHRSMRLR